MNVAILGLGTVGRGVYDLLMEQPDIHISYVLERNEANLESIDAPVAPSFDVIVNDPSVDIIIELIGGIDTAYEFITKALSAGKHVITANKAVISRYYNPLQELANTHNVSLLFEASVGGAIIVLHPLLTISKINHITSIEGIVNGSTNYVLSRIFDDGLSSKEAIDEAFERGYLEPTSTDDMDGLDAMRKITILSTIAYQGYLSESNVDVVPLSSITPAFYQYVSAQGYTMKYIAKSSNQNNQVTMSVMPVVLPQNNPFQDISYELNTITVRGRYHKAQTFVGQGAGRYPTASAVLYDVLLIQNQIVPTHTYPNALFVIQDKPQSFLVQTTSGFELIENTTTKALRQQEDVICFARMEGVT